MEKPINKLIKIIKEGILFKTFINHGKGGARHNYCSNALPSHNAIVKGQCENPKDSKVNAVLSFFSANTDKLLGKSLSSLLVLMKQSLLDLTSHLYDFF